MSKTIEEINSKDFLKEPLDNAWFDKGINQETFPSFGTNAFNKNIDYTEFIKSGIDEEKLGLYCIGGTQAAKVVVKDFKPIINGDEIGYEATVVLQYTDTFGVSEADYTKDLNITIKGLDIPVPLNIVDFNYRGGVMAQWVLQHQYGYQPFEDFLTYKIKMKKTWKK